MNVGAHGETLRQMVADTSEMPVKAVELIKGLYVVEGAMAQDHGIDYLFDNIGILTASVRDMLSREAERGQWEGQYKSLIDKCEEMRGDEEWDCRDTDTLVDGFAKAVEHEADAAFEVARIKGELPLDRRTRRVRYLRQGKPHGCIGGNLPRRNDVEPEI